MATYHEPTDTHYLLLYKEVLGNVVLSELYILKEHGKKSEHSKFYTDKNTPAKIGKMFWSQNLIILCDATNKLLFINDFKNENWNRVKTNRGISKIIFLNDSVDIFATIDIIDQVYF